jgi:VIT1/CCC1 family predicted Fe2+/Mn2+ transporter
METNITALIDIKFVVAQVLLTYGILAYGIKNPTSVVKHLLSFLVGCLLGVIWYIIIKATLDTLIISFLIAVIGYDKIINPILKQLNVENYNNNKGIV